MIMKYLKTTFVRRKSVPEAYLVEHIPAKAPFTVSVYPAMAESHRDSQASLSGCSTGPRSETEFPPRFSKRPNLAQILAEQSPEPWTLHAFVAYAERNLCVENIEFIQDAERYKSAYTTILGNNDPKTSSSLADRPIFRRASSANTERLKEMWTRIILLYIAPSSPKELNIPGNIRAGLIPHNKNAIPPSPKVLEPAITKVTELIEDSILFPFLNELQPSSSSVHKGSDGSIEGHAPEKSESRHASGQSSREMHRSDPSLPPKRSPKLGTFAFPKHRPNSSAKSSTTSFGGGPTSHPGSAAPTLSEDSESAVISPVGSHENAQPRTPPSSSGGDIASKAASPKRPKDASWKRMSSRFGFGKKAPASQLKDVMENHQRIAEE